MKVVILEGSDLERFREMMSQMPDVPMSNLRVGIDEEGLKFSVNYETWHPGFGITVDGY